jgi:hypothetical protein
VNEKSSIPKGKKLYEVTIWPNGYRKPPELKEFVLRDIDDDGMKLFNEMKVKHKGATISIHNEEDATRVR